MIARFLLTAVTGQILGSSRWLRSRLGTKLCVSLSNKLSYKTILTTNTWKENSRTSKAVCQQYSSCQAQLVVVFSTSQQFENSTRIDCVQFLLGFYQSSLEPLKKSKRTGRKKSGMDIRWLCNGFHLGFAIGVFCVSLDFSDSQIQNTESFVLYLQIPKLSSL